jgi:hypothetical protein
MSLLPHKVYDTVVLISGDLILGNLVSSEPLDKLCQSGWEGSLDRTAGNP